MITIDIIKRDFNIEFDEPNLILEVLKEKRNELHPDRNKGVFKDKSHEEEYYKVDEYINYIDSLKNNNSLAIIEQVTSLVKVVAELIPNTKENTLQNNLESRINYAIENHKSKLFFPKISLTAISAVMTFLIAFPTQIKDNVILSRYLNTQSSFFAFTWLVMLVYTGMFWYITYSNQEKGKRKLSLLKVDSIQNELFERFIFRIERQDFSKDELTNYIFESYSRHRNISSLFFGDNTITLEISQSIAEIIIARGEKKGVLKLSTENSLSDLYIIKNFE